MVVAGGGVVVGVAVAVGGGVVVGTGGTTGAGALDPFGLHLPHDEWQFLGSAAQSSAPSLAKSAQVLELGMPAGATSLQHLPQERSQEVAREEQAPAAATASQVAKPLDVGGGASEHMPHAPKVQL